MLFKTMKVCLFLIGNEILSGKKVGSKAIYRITWQICKIQNLFEKRTTRYLVTSLSMYKQFCYMNISILGLLHLFTVFKGSHKTLLQASSINRLKTELPILPVSCNEIVKWGQNIAFGFQFTAFLRFLLQNDLIFQLFQSSI